jgi:hypothetical protein
LFPGVEGASRRFFSGIIGGRPSLTIPTDKVDLVLEPPFGFEMFPLCPGAEVTSLCPASELAYLLPFFPLCPGVEFASLCPASELAYLLPFFPNKPFRGLKKLLAMLPTSLAAGVDGADKVPDTPVFVVGAVDEIRPADLVLVGGRGVLLVWSRIFEFETSDT